MYLVDGKPSLFPAGAAPHLVMRLVQPGTTVCDPDAPMHKAQVLDSNSVIIKDSLYCTPLVYHQMKATMPKRPH